MKKTTRRSVILSLITILITLGLTYGPLPGFQQSIVVVSGTELQEPLEFLQSRFKDQHPNINLILKFQGSQDIVDNYLDEKNDFNPTVIIPASEEFLKDLDKRWKAQNNSDTFYDNPRAITKTFLVAVSWAERAKALFPDGIFKWQRLEEAISARNWNKLGNYPNWGSFDLIIADPLRSNSGQQTLYLWAAAKLNNNNLNFDLLNKPEISELFSLIKKSIYQTPRSTDLLLKEFISKGPNEGDIAIVYESAALFRRQESSKTTGGIPYKIYYINPTVETIQTAAIVHRKVDQGQANAAREFINFLTQPQQQQVFAQYGFRSVNSGSLPNVQVTTSPNFQTLDEIKRIWQRSN